MGPIQLLLTIALPLLTSVSGHGQTKPSAKPAISPEQLSKYKVMQFSDKNYRNYCWLDDKTLIIAIEAEAQKLITRPADQYIPLLNELERKHQEVGSFGSLDIAANGKCIIGNIGRSHHIFSLEGKFLSDGYDNLVISPDGRQIVTWYKGHNLSILRYPIMRLKEIVGQKEGTRITNDRQHPVFTEGGIADIGFSNQFLIVLSHPFRASLKDNYDSDESRLWILKRSRTNLNGRTSRKELNIPISGRIIRSFFSPDSEQFLLMIHSGKEGKLVHICLGSINSTQTKLLLTISNPGALFDFRVKWKPNNKEISFVYNNTLYAIPVE